MHGQLVQEDDIARLRLDRNSLRADEMVRDRLTAVVRPRVVAMQRKAAFVTTWRDQQTPVLFSRFGHRNPHREHLGVVRFRRNRALILVPNRRRDFAAHSRVVFKALGRRFDSGVLRWVRQNLGADETFDRIEQLRVT